MTAEPLRVAHVLDSGGLYGAERVVLELMVAQTELGMAPVLFSLGSENDGPKAIEMEAERLGLPTRAVRVRRIFDPLEIMRLCRSFHEEGVQVVHSHGYKFDILGALFRKSFQQAAFVATAHGYVKHRPPSRMYFYELADRFALAYADRVVLVDASMRGLAGLKALPADRVVVIENGISEDSARAALPSDIEVFLRRVRHRICAVGRLAPEKGFDLLLEAIASISECGHIGLVIFGEGRLRKDLESLAARLGIAERVCFAGYHANVARFFHHFDLLCMPSRTEGLPVTLLEAMRARLPVVASRVGGIERTTQLPGGACVSLVDPEDVLGLGDALDRAVKDPCGALQLAEKGRAHFLEKFSALAMAKKYERVYSEAMASSNDRLLGKRSGCA